EEAETTGKRRLFDSLLAQARASRTSQRQGRRFQSLDLVAEASQLARSLDLGENEFRKLRSEAASSLALADMRVVHEWQGWPDGTFSIAFDGALERYARVDTNQRVSIRRVADDELLYELPALGRGEAFGIFSNDGRFFAFCSRMPHVMVWKLTGTSAVKVL